jgi:hypothetical protein
VKASWQLGRNPRMDAGEDTIFLGILSSIIVNRKTFATFVIGTRGHFPRENTTILRHQVQVIRSSLTHFWLPIDFPGPMTSFEPFAVEHTHFFLAFRMSTRQLGGGERGNCEWPGRQQPNSCVPHGTRPTRAFGSLLSLTAPFPLKFTPRTEAK